MQKLFETMVNGVLSQGGFGYPDNEELDACQYLTLEGKRCAVGQLAADDEQAGDWEDRGLTVEAVAQELNQPRKSQELMSHMQAEHDYQARLQFPDLKAFRRDACKLGAKFGLKTDKIIAI